MTVPPGLGITVAAGVSYYQREERGPESFTEFVRP
jgi:hypothetical protein